MNESPTRPNSIQPFPLAPWFSQNHLLRPSNQREPSGARLPAAIALSRYQNGERTERSSAPQHNPSIPFALAPSLSQIHLSLQPKATRADARAPGFQLVPLSEWKDRQSTPARPDSIQPVALAPSFGQSHLLRPSTTRAARQDSTS